MITKKILIPMAAVAVIVAGGYGVAQVSAASSPSTGQTLAQRIAGTFGLDQSKVQGVIDQYRGDKQAQAETRYEQMLSQSVTDDKITSDQKTAILAEHNKLKSELDAAQGKTGTDRHTAVQQVRTDAENWSKQNNLPAKWLPGRPPDARHGPLYGAQTAAATARPARLSALRPLPSPPTRGRTVLPMW